MPIEVEVKKHIYSPEVEKTFVGLAQQLSYKAIAYEQEKSEETIKSYAKLIREDFGVCKTGEAILLAIARGIITIKEVGGKTLIACGLIVASGFVHDDQDYTRYAKTRLKPRIERRINEA